MRGQPGLFDVDLRLKRLRDLGDQLLAFAAAVDFEVFRPELNRALAYSHGSQGDRPAFDPVMMFKVRVIQAANTLSESPTEIDTHESRKRCRASSSKGSGGSERRQRAGAPAHD
jgi:hypothetical protein